MTEPPCLPVAPVMRIVVMVMECEIQRKTIREYIRHNFSEVAKGEVCQLVKFGAILNPDIMTSLLPLFSLFSSLLFLSTLLVYTSRLLSFILSGDSPWSKIRGRATGYRLQATGFIYNGSKYPIIPSCLKTGVNTESSSCRVSASQRKPGLYGETWKVPALIQSACCNIKCPPDGATNPRGPQPGDFLLLTVPTTRAEC